MLREVSTKLREYSTKWSVFLDGAIITYSCFHQLYFMQNMSILREEMLEIDVEKEMEVLPELLL